MKALKIPIIDMTTIKKLLPHREPMIMVNSLLEFADGKAIVGFTILKENLFVADDEFSETGLIEHMAQAAALYTGFKNHNEETAAKEGFIASIKKLKIHKLPKIDDHLITEVTIIHEIMHMTSIKLSTFNKGIEIAHAEMNTVLKE
ncbi:putative hotdog family 3-hydroxylacyl-ACP dehydratase [Gelidibacter algens]|uniref:Putative hotdog family 3-hydroxylacyl-ACP dehydratase n=1 Tax=Gelidibacter algens TaxID=49280 RepID=A0A1A7R325_9FLAO|nr:hypothetical protein [Gelidibacter algens]OBX26665.1 hypothetical protein A9996_03640 [Gelidibacter algens]RAJ25722.1 putative hotdog family 3-hydroxylacyl-ACP dehydratase [Gelidibacter algens]